MKETPYQILGVSEGATAEEIKARYRFLCLAFHPDRFSTESQKQNAEQEFKRIEQAYRKLVADTEKSASFNGSPLQPSESNSESEQTPPQEPKSSEWTEADTADVRNWARVLARIILSASACFLAYLATRSFHEKDAETFVFICAFLAVYFQGISWYVLKPDFQPSAWLRIPVKGTFWIGGIVLFFSGFTRVLGSGWKWENVLFLTEGALLMIVAKLLYENEKRLHWFRVFFRVCMVCAILFILGIHYFDAIWGFIKPALIPGVFPSDFDLA